MCIDGHFSKMKKKNKHKKLIQKYFLKKIKTKTNHNWWEEKRIEYHKRRKKKGGNVQKHIKHSHTHTQKHQNVQNFFSPIISTIWRNWVLVGPRRKTPGPSNFLSHYQTATSIIFFPLFSYLFSIHPLFTPTK